MREFKVPVVPPSRPSVSLAEAEAYLDHAGFDRRAFGSGVVVLFTRGHFLDGQGERGRNDHNTYDDGAIVCELVNGRVVRVWTFNANADPRGESGVNAAVGKGWPTLQPGVHSYRFGLHQSKYLALKPYTTVTVRRVTADRDASGPEEQNATINIHAGGNDWTWSWGCLTVHASQYGPRTKFLARTGKGFIDRVWQLAEAHHQGASLAPDGRAGFRALAGRTDERPVPVVVVDEAAFRRAR